MVSSGNAADGSAEDQRAASNLVTTLSGYLITAALAVLGAQAVVATFVIDRRQHLTLFYAVSSAGTLFLVLSVVLGGAGIYEIVSDGFQGRWKIETIRGKFNVQALLVLSGTVFVVWSAFLGDTVRHSLG